MRISSLLLILLFGTIIACRENDDAGEQVPMVPIDIVLNLNLPEFIDLTNPGGWVYINGGSRGIMIYRVTLDEFAVHDRHCSYQVAEGCSVSIDESSIIAKDEQCCESTFSVIDGVPLSGQALRPLLRYQTQFNPNTNQLRIFN